MPIQRVRALLATAALAIALAPATVLASDFTQFNHDGARTGYDPDTTSAVTPQLAWTGAADDGIYAQPLAFNGRVYVATESNSLYAFNLATGHADWVDAGMATAVNSASFQCGNIGPNNGITGTPAIDAAGHTIFAVGLDAADHRYHLFARSTDDGSARPGDGTIVSPGANFDWTAQGQRPALTLAGGRVYVEYGGREGDCGTYHGWVTSVKTDGTGYIEQLLTGGNGGGIWDPAGATTDGASLYVVTGNTVNCCGGVGLNGSTDGSDVVFRLDLATLGLQDWWTPTDWQSLALSDIDVSAVNPALVDYNQVVQVGKSGEAYLLNRSNLGHISDGIAHFHLCGGAYGGDAYLSGSLYVPCRDGVHRVAIGNGSFSATASNSGPDNTPVIGGGYVWAMSRCRLWGMDPATLATVFNPPAQECSRSSFPAVAISNGYVIQPGATHVYAWKVGNGGSWPPPPTTMRPWTGGHDAIGDTAPAADAYFAEGYTGFDFQTYYTVLNTTANADTLHVDYLEKGGSVGRDYALPANSRLTIDVNTEIGPDQEVAAHLHTVGGSAIVAERPMYFAYPSAYGTWTGGHDAVGLAAARQDFYFAEGYTQPGFDEYLTVANPGATTANVAITYYSNGGPVLAGPQTLAVGPGRRATVKVNDVPGMITGDVSTYVHADRPIVAERPMYFNFNGWDGGHVAIGVAATQTSVNLAEGYVASSFATYLTLFNPDPANDVTAQVTFFTAGGGHPTLTRLVPRGTRQTIAVQDALASLGYASPQEVSFQIDSDHAGLVVERPMYFNYLGWTGGHDAVAIPPPPAGTAWWLAEGYVSPSFDEYVTIENPNPAPAAVTLHFIPQANPASSCPADVPLAVAPTSRYTYKVNWVVGSGNACALRVTSPARIFVERPMYFAY